MYKLLWMAYSFFDNLFWFLKFYFRRFDSNLRSIAFDFLVNVKIEIIEIVMKKTSNMGSVLEVSGKIYFGPLIFKITRIILFYKIIDLNSI